MSSSAAVERETPTPSSARSFSIRSFSARSLSSAKSRRWYSARNSPISSVSSSPRGSSGPLVVVEHDHKAGERRQSPTIPPCPQRLLGGESLAFELKSAADSFDVLAARPQGGHPRVVLRDATRGVGHGTQLARRLHRPNRHAAFRTVDRSSGDRSPLSTTLRSDPGPRKRGAGMPP
jgi:hypothetical protein